MTSRFTRWAQRDSVAVTGNAYLKKLPAMKQLRGMAMAVRGGRCFDVRPSPSMLRTAPCLRQRPAAGSATMFACRMWAPALSQLPDLASGRPG